MNQMEKQGQSALSSPFNSITLQMAIGAQRKKIHRRNKENGAALQSLGDSIQGGGKMPSPLWSGKGEQGKRKRKRERVRRALGSSRGFIKRLSVPRSLAGYESGGRTACRCSPLVVFKIERSNLPRIQSFRPREERRLS